MTKSSKAEKELFVGISKPKALRKELLETLRDIISLIKRNEKLKKARADRYEAVAELRVMMNDIAVGLAKLEQLLPSFDFETPKLEPLGKAKEEKPRTKDEEIDMLESELAEVEAKLRMI